MIHQANYLEYHLGLPALVLNYIGAAFYHQCSPGV